MQDGSAKPVASRHLVQEGAVREGPEVQQEQRVHHITVVQQVIVVAAQRGTRRCQSSQHAMLQSLCRGGGQ